MAYMSQEKKSELAPAIKAICKKYGIKATIAVSSCKSALVLNIKSGPIDFITDAKMMHQKNNRDGRPCYISDDYMQVNHYHYEKQHSGSALDFLREVIPAMMVGNYDNSDIQSDFYDCGWYIDVNIGQWNKPYQYIPTV